MKEPWLKLAAEFSISRYQLGQPQNKVPVHDLLKARIALDLDERKERSEP